MPSITIILYSSDRWHMDQVFIIYPVRAFQVPMILQGLVIPASGLRSCCDRSLLLQARPSAWMSLPRNVRCAKTVQQCKKRCLRHISFFAILCKECFPLTELTYLPAAELVIDFFFFLFAGIYVYTAPRTVLPDTGGLYYYYYNYLSL